MTPTTTVNDERFPSADVLTADDYRGMAPDEFDYPSATKATIVGDRIVFVTVAYDESAENPLEHWDGQGEIISRLRRHTSGDPERAEREMAENRDAVPLDYFEHGQCEWSVAGSGPQCRWDTAHHAGVWIPDAETLAAIPKGHKRGEKRRAWMVERARTVAQLFTDYCNGDVFGYTVTVYRLRVDSDGEPYDALDDYRRDDEIHDASCWGFYGDDARGWMIEQIIAEGIKPGLSEPLPVAVAEPANGEPVAATVDSLRCPFCGCTSIVHGVAEWSAVSLEPADPSNTGALSENHCVDCSASFWTGIETTTADETGDG